MKAKLGVPTSLAQMTQGAERKGAAIGAMRWIPRRDSLMSAGLFVILLLAWHFSKVWFEIPPFILPAPLEVVDWLVKGLSVSPARGNDASLWYHLAVTMQEALYGFLIGSGSGVISGMLLARWSLAERVLMPFIVAFQSLPKIAIAPLLVIWFGFGIEAKVLIAALLCYFPLLLGSLSGYHSVEPDRIDMARSCNASEMQIFRKVILPSALPFIFAGLHMAVIVAILGAIVGEFVGAEAGLGMLLLRYNNGMQTAGVFAVLLLLGLLGYGLSICMRLMEDHFCFWARRKKTFNTSSEG